MVDPIPFRKGGKSVRWDMIERLARWYMVGGLESDPEFQEISTLTDDEREALRWEMQRRDANLRHLSADMGEVGAGTIGDLGKG